MKLIARRMLVDAGNDGDTATVDTSKLGTVETTHIIEWGVGVAAGVVQIECAGSDDYAGAWAPVVTMTMDPTDGRDCPKADYVRVAGDYPALRHRVDGAIEGGTVSSRTDGSN